MSPLTAPLPLARALVRCPSVTPNDAGALDLLTEALDSLGFRCERLRFEEAGTEPVDNLYARLGDGPPNLAFSGHVDVVQTGDPALWQSDPFGGDVIDETLFGRGAADMKGAIACFVAAVARYLAESRPRGSISLLLTADEEGPGINGTVKILRWLGGRGERLDACIVGEPTNPSQVGEMIKIGRRGSLTGQLTVSGRQGHTAYAHLADNPIPRLLAMLRLISEEPLDGGSEHFEPSELILTSIDVGNPASNVVPGVARATFNIRFNDQQTGSRLEAWLHERFRRVGGDYQLEIRVTGDAFLTLPGPLTELLESVIETELEIVPELSTSGGTSDARFIKDACPVVEFGLINATIHQINERVPLAALERLTHVYTAFLRAYFKAA